VVQAQSLLADVGDQPRQSVDFGVGPHVKHVPVETNLSLEPIFWCLPRKYAAVLPLCRTGTCRFWCWAAC
jgi:hypothetical protein